MVERVLTDPVDPGIMTGLAAEVRSTFARIAGHVGGERSAVSVLRLPLVLLALMVHAVIALYAALPPMRRPRRESPEPEPQAIPPIPRAGMELPRVELPTEY
jgi:hypothetical protein